MHPAFCATPVFTPASFVGAAGAANRREAVGGAANRMLQKVY